MFSIFTLSTVALCLINTISADKILLPRTTGIPSSILSELLTAIPPASLADLANPASYAIVSSQIAAGETPNWYSGLPPDVKAYFSNEASVTGTAATAAQTSAVSAYRTSVFMSENTQASTQSSTGTTSISSQATGTTSTHTGASATSTASSSGSSGFSTGAIVGTAIAAIIFIAVATGLAIWFILKRSKRSKDPAAIAEQPPAMGGYENTAYQGAAYQQYQNGPYQSVPNPATAPYDTNGPPLYDPAKVTPPAVVESGAQEVYEVDGGSTVKR